MKVVKFLASYILLINKKIKREEEKKNSFRKIAGFAGFLHLVFRFLAAISRVIDKYQVPFQKLLIHHFP